MVRAGWFVFRSISTSFAPPGTRAAMAGAAGSSTQRFPSGLATTLWTQTQWSFAETSSLRALRQEFQATSGNGTSLPSFTSATDTSVSSVHRGKLTKIRPSFATVTPVT